MKKEKNEKTQGLKVSEINNQLLKEFGMTYISKKTAKTTSDYLRIQINNLGFKEILGTSPKRYSFKTVEKIKAEKPIIEYYERYTNNSIEILSNETLIRLYYNNISETIKKEWEQAGLSEQEGLLLEVDKIGQKKYLRADEMIFLQDNGFALSGITLRQSVWQNAKPDFFSSQNISNSKKQSEVNELLEWYNQSKLIEKEQEIEIERMYSNKVHDIMLSALFDMFFSIDRELLKNDIRNYIKYGLHDTIVTKNGAILEDGNQEVTRAYLRLQKNASYYSQKVPASSISQIQFKLNELTQTLKDIKS